MSDSVTRKVKGGRAAFFADADTDRLLAMLMRLLTEHWALRERVMTLETLLRERDLLSAEELESFVPAAEVDAQWDQESYALVQAVIEAGQNVDRRNRD